MKTIVNISKPELIGVLTDRFAAKFSECYKCGKDLIGYEFNIYMHPECWQFSPKKERDQAILDLSYAVHHHLKSVEKGKGCNMT